MTVIGGRGWILRTGGGPVRRAPGRGVANTAGDPYPQRHHHRHDRDARQHAKRGKRQVHAIASNDSVIRIKA